MKCSDNSSVKKQRCNFGGQPSAEFVEIHVIAALTNAAEQIAGRVQNLESAQIFEDPELLELKRTYADLCSIQRKNPAIEAAKLQVEEQIRVKEQEVANQVVRTNFAYENFKSQSELYRESEYWRSLVPDMKRDLFRRFVSVVRIDAEKVRGTRLNQYLVAVQLKF